MRREVNCDYIIAIRPFLIKMVSLVSRFFWYRAIPAIPSIPLRYQKSFLIKNVSVSQVSQPSTNTIQILSILSWYCFMTKAQSVTCFTEALWNPRLSSTYANRICKKLILKMKFRKDSNVWNYVRLQPHRTSCTSLYTTP